MQCWSFILAAIKCGDITTPPFLWIGYLHLPKCFWHRHKGTGAFIYSGRETEWGRKLVNVTNETWNETVALPWIFLFESRRKKFHQQWWFLKMKTSTTLHSTDGELYLFVSSGWGKMWCNMRIKLTIKFYL